jgi:hypothetical protein
MVLVVVGGLALLIQGGTIITYILAVISIMVGGTLAFVEYWNLLIINKPRLIISTTGIQASDGEFYEWSIISNEKIVSLGSIKPAWFLWFETPGRNRKLHLDGLDKRPDQIVELIRHYRNLNKQSH